MGNPNTGKTSVFNLLTGARRRVSNYPGVTVERASGKVLWQNRRFEIIDLPGTYSLNAHTPDERIAVDVLRGNQPGEDAIDLVIVVVDADNLERNLFLVSQLKDLAIPVVVALTMLDLAERHGQPVDAAALAARLGLPVVPVQGRTGAGRDALLAAVAATADAPRAGSAPAAAATPMNAGARYAWCAEVAAACTPRAGAALSQRRSERLDDVLTHPVLGGVILLVVMGLTFISVFTWAAPLMDAIDGLFAGLADAIRARVGSPMLASFLADGVVTGVGGVLVFLPQILILIALVTVLEDCGYLARAAFLMDRIMRFFGLGGRSFVPLLSSFACAIPGIMAARTVGASRDRLLTILVAPLMPCSARIPVYTLLVLAFVPQRRLAGIIPLQGLVFASVYAFGVVVAAGVAVLLKKAVLRGETAPFLLELPGYKMPTLRTIVLRLYDRTRDFVTTAGTIILAMSVIIWALGYFPRPAAVAERVRAQLAAEQVLDPETVERAVAGEYLRQSYLARMGQALEPAVRPLGWDWRIGTAVLAAFPAREVVVSTMGIIYNLGPDAAEDTGALHEKLRAAKWPDGSRVFTLPVAISVMVFFALCCQCQATVAVIRRETNSWKWAGFAFTYLTALAYVFALAVYQFGSRLG